MSFLLTMDIGGTLTKISLISRDKALLSRTEIETPNSLTELYKWLDRYMKDENQGRSIKGIALSSPGSISETGEVLGYSAVPFLHNVNLITRFQERFQLPISVENDANCAALAEKWNGAAMDLSSYACIVCGTGVGGALVLNGQLWKGAHLHGGEFGYAILNSGQYDASTYTTWSELGSASAISRRLRGSGPFEKEWTGERAFAAMAEGNLQARKSIQTFFHHLAVGVFNIQYTIDPEKILIGGGITRQPDFLSLLTKEIEGIYNILPYAKVCPDVKLCHYLGDAQLLGAAYVWEDKYGEG